MTLSPDEAARLKRCTRCGQTKPWSDFHVRRRVGAPRPIPHCKACAVTRTQNWKRDNPEKYIQLNEHRNQLARARGIELLGPIDRCAICGAKLDGKHHAGAQLDHDHDTGDARGWLCHGCNKGLGCLGDNPALLRAAATYLDERGAAPTRPLIR